MKKSIIATIGIIVLLVIGAYFGGLYSVISGNTTNLRQDEIPCGTEQTYYIEDYTIQYTTKSVSASLLNPTTDMKTTCVITRYVIDKGSSRIFSYDNVYGIVVDDVSNNPYYSLLLVDTYKNKETGTYLKISNGYVKYARFDIATKGNTISPILDSVIRDNGDSYKTPSSFMMVAISNSGWNDGGYTIGVKLKTVFYPRNSILHSDFENDNMSITFSVQSEVPLNIKYDDVCIDFGTKGILGDILWQELCLGLGGELLNNQEKDFVVVLPITNFTEYYVRGRIQNMKGVITNIDTQRVSAYDLGKLQDGMVVMGNYISDEQYYNVSVITPVEEPPVEEPPVEEPLVEEKPENQSVWNTGMIIAVVLLSLGVFMVVYSVRKKIVS